MVVLLAVGTSVVLKECNGCQFLLTLGAGKVLRMPGLPHGIDHLAKDGPVTGSTGALWWAENRRDHTYLTSLLKLVKHAYACSPPTVTGPIKAGFGPWWKYPRPVLSYHSAVSPALSPAH